MRGEVNNIQRGKLGRVSTPLCPLANSTAGHPWVTSLSKGQRVLKCPDNPAALGGAGGGGVAQRARVKPLSPFIIQRQSSPQSGPIFPWPCLQWGHSRVSCPNVLFILLNKETGSWINIGGRCVLLSGAGSPTRRRLQALPGFQRGV